MKHVILPLLASAIAAPASAQLIEVGNYLLSNHPDGNAAPPQYGLRLDELVDVTSSKDIFTFDFNHDDSLMLLTYDGSSIRIFGEAFGGRDVGGAYANDQYLGLYSIDFTYDVGVQQAPNDDDLIVAADMQNDGQNSGSISGPGGVNAGLWDKSTGSFTFRFGNENNDNGHRGFDGISGWGWLNHTVPDTHIAASDWLFTATRTLIPTPATATIAGLGLVLAGRRGRD